MIVLRAKHPLHATWQSSPRRRWNCLSPEGLGGGVTPAGAPPCGDTRRQHVLMPDVPRGEEGDSDPRWVRALFPPTGRSAHLVSMTPVSGGHTRRAQPLRELGLFSICFNMVRTGLWYGHELLGQRTFEPAVLQHGTAWGERQGSVGVSHVNESLRSYPRRFTREDTGFYLLAYRRVSRHVCSLVPVSRKSNLPRGSNIGPRGRQTATSTTQPIASLRR